MADSTRDVVEEHNETGGDKVADASSEIVTSTVTNASPRYVGIVKEIGDTPYVNSLLQVLYHIPLFRKSTTFPTQGNVGPTVSSLKRLFKALESSDVTVSKAGLTLLGYSLYEDLGTLFSELKEAMEGTEDEGAIAQLFEVVHGTKDEINTSYGLHLDTTNCEKIYSALEKCRFTTLPPVLLLNLLTTKATSFKYDYQVNIQTGDATRNSYTLHSVIVEKGTGGTCYAIITPKLSNTWTLFEDEKVEDLPMRFNASDRDEYPPFKFKEGGQPIALVYCLKEERNKIRCIDNQELDAKLEAKEIDPSYICSLCPNARSANEDIEDCGLMTSRAPKTKKVTKYEKKPQSPPK